MLTFAGMLDAKAEPFGQLNKPYFGVSDGNSGVQWNLRIYRETGDAALGVNLEGLAYKDWPIANFLLNELEEPTLHEMIDKCEEPEELELSLTRDAWLPSGSRLSIVESQIGGNVQELSKVTRDQWSSIVLEALNCLNESKGYRGRTKQKVTHSSDGRVTEKWVTPHLTIRTAVSAGESTKERLQRCFDLLTPAYDWLTRRSQA